MLKELEDCTPDNCMINIRISRDKKCKSCVNSPKTMPETPVGTFFQGMGKDDSANLKTQQNFSSEIQKKMRGLEEIGLFSEFEFAKKVSFNCKSDDDLIKKPSIHITDLMSKDEKRKFLQDLGEFDMYLNKKDKFQKKSLLFEGNLRNFFNPLEKKPEFFSTPVIPKRFINPKPPASRQSFLEKGKKLSSIDSIIEKCDEAISLKLPKVISKSSSEKSKRLNTPLINVKRSILSKNT